MSGIFRYKVMVTSEETRDGPAEQARPPSFSRLIDDL